MAQRACAHGDCGLEGNVRHFLERAGKCALSVVIAAGLAFPSAGAFADEAPSSASTVSSATHDLNALWSSDAPLITEGGTYTLSADLTVDEALTVELDGDDDPVVIDLAGHNVTVEGDATSAIDLTKSTGSITVTDSTYDAAHADDDSADAEAAAPTSGISLESDNPAQDLVVVDARTQATSDEAAPSLTVEKVALAGTSTVTEGASLGRNVTDVATSSNALAQGGSDSEVSAAAHAAVALELSDVSLSASVDVQLASDEQQAARASYGEGAAVALDGAAPGTVLDGYVGLATAGGATLATALVHEGAPYTIGSDCTLAADLVLVPADASAALPFDAAVASDASGQASLSDSVKAHLKAADGYAVSYSDDGARATLDAASTAAEESESSSQLSASASAVAPSSSSSSSSTAEAPSATVMATAASSAATTSGTDLNASWTDTSSAYYITQGGTYYLSGDLTASNYLVVNAPGADVTIAFNGHTLTTSGSLDAARKSMLSIASARSVTLDGTSEAGTSTFASAGGGDQWAVYASSQAACALTITDLSIELSATSPTLQNLGTHCVYAESGSVFLSNCTLTMDMGNQTTADAVNTVSAATAPAAVYAGPSVSSLSLSDCTVSATGTPAVQLTDMTDLTSVGNAYAVYSLAVSTAVSGGSYSATSAAGSAAAILASNLTVSGDAVTVSAGAAVSCAGVIATKAGGVRLDAPVIYSADADRTASGTVSAALRSTVENAFVFGANATGQGLVNYSVLVMPGALSAANDDGMRIGTFEPMTDMERQSLSARLANALGDDAACTIAADDAGACFSLDDDHAVARIGDTSFATIDAALAAFDGSATLEVRTDLPSLTVDGAATGTIDLGGHTVGTLTYRTSGERTGGLTVQNGTVQATEQTSAGLAGIVYDSPNDLTLSGITLSAYGTSTAVKGVYASGACTGALIVEDSAFTVGAARGLSTASAVGIDAQAATALPVTVRASSIAVTVDTPSTDATGIYAPASADVENATVTVEGSSGATGGVRAAGTVRVADSTVDVSTSQVASTAYGIWGMTSPAAESVTVDASSVRVTSSSDATGSSYWCLMGSQQQNTASKAAWTIDGACAFESSTGTHFGMNLSTVTLGEDFSLVDASDETLSVWQSATTGDVGFTGENGADLSRFAGTFTAAAGSAYDGWELVASDGDASKLVWRPSGVDGAVSLERGGAKVAAYNRVSDALAAAKSGDTLVLTADVAETAALSVLLQNLTLDLAGHTLTLRAGSGALAGKTGTGAALAYGGGGTLSVTSTAGAGTVRLEVGQATETARSYGPYQGISVYGGGTLSVDAQASVDVAYTGGATTSLQRGVELRGIAVANGTVDLAGDLSVTSARSENVIGALDTYGIYATPASGDSATIDQADGAQVAVNGITAVQTTDSTFYPGMSEDNQSSRYLREIHPNPETDADFYETIQEAFKAQAKFDPRTGYDTSSQFGAGIYYTAGALTLSAEGKWYDGLEVWAYSDAVDDSAIGTLDAVTATHFFIQSAVDTVPEAYGIASADGAKGTVNVSVEGEVSVSNEHGSAVSLDTRGQGEETWNCAGTEISATGDSSVHPVSQGSMDLRNYIDLPSTITRNVFYYSQFSSDTYAVSYEAPLVRGIVVGNDADLTLDGSCSFDLAGSDAADVEANTFAVGASFAMSDGSACTVANASGANAAGKAFAASARSDQGALDPSRFADAYGSLVPSASGSSLVWADDADAHSVTFMNGDAVVARYASDDAIDFDELNASVARPSDGQFDYVFAGWSKSNDDLASSGYETSVSPSGAEDETYYAVFAPTAVSDIQVTFANVHDASGNLVSDETAQVSFGGTLADAGATVPEPADYTDDAGTTYRFVGWYPSTSASPSSAVVRNPDTIASELVFDGGTAGATSGNVTLWATYVVVGSNQHLVTFQVDESDPSWVSAYAVNDGDHPRYLDANPTDTTYEAPEMIDEAEGSTYAFAYWKDTASGATYSLALPAATQDATYCAGFTETAADAAIVFYYWHPDASGTYANSAFTVRTTYDASEQSEADKLVKVGDSVNVGGVSYTFLGWGVRDTDKEPLYTSDNPIPSADWSQKIGASSTYTKTYYGIYKASARSVTVNFVDGGQTVGSVETLASSTIQSAFAQTGAAAPGDRSSDETFLGWNSDASATTVLSPSTTLATVLVGDNTASSVNLYAVFGARPVYTVRLENTDGSSIATLSVTSGTSINDRLAETGLSFSNPVKMGSYFTGWATAAGRAVSLDDPVTGALTLYPTYSDNLTVSVSGDEGLSAEVGVANSESAQATSVTFAASPAASADYPLRNFAGANGYSVLKSYYLSVSATGADGSTAQLQSFDGQADVTVYVGSAYANAVVRAFWLDDSDSGVAYSEALSVDANGCITVPISQFVLGDADEGGNLAIVYRALNNTTSVDGTVSTVASAPASGAGVAAVTAPAVAAAAKVAAATANAAPAAASAQAAPAAEGAAGDLAASQADDTASDDDDGSGDEAADESGWDADTVIVLVVLALLVAGIIWGLRRFFLAGSKKDDDDDEDEAEAAPAHTESIRF